MAEAGANIAISARHLTAADRVLVIDDFLANGHAAKALIDLIQQAGAAVVQQHAVDLLPGLAIAAQRIGGQLARPAHALECRRAVQLDGAGCAAAGFKEPTGDQIGFRTWGSGTAAVFEQTTLN